MEILQKVWGICLVTLLAAWPAPKTKAVHRAAKPRLAMSDESLQLERNNGYTFDQTIIGKVSTLIRDRMHCPLGERARGGWMMTSNGTIFKDPPDTPMVAPDACMRVTYDIAGRSKSCHVRIYVSGIEAGSLQFSGLKGVQSRVEQYCIHATIMEHSPLLGLLLLAAENAQSRRSPRREGRTLRAFLDVDGPSAVVPLPQSLLRDVPSSSRIQGALFPSVQELDHAAAIVVHIGGLLGYRYNITVKIGDVKLECVPE